MKMAMNNKLLEQKAYTDAHTGLPNKDACELLLNTPEKVKESTACMMFDLNNLKIVNDTMGHSAGDRLIMDFAQLLRSVIPEKILLEDMAEMSLWQLFITQAKQKLRNC